jgi:hypothetical protein
MKVTAIAPEDCRSSRWAFGASKEIYRLGDPFQWRASVATIDAGGEFSAFPGYDRLIALLGGGPLRLHLDTGTIDVEPRLSAKRFPGSPAPVASGEYPCTVFNLIYDAQSIEARLLPRPLVGAMVLFNEPQVSWLIYMLSGEASLRLGDQHLWLGGGHGALVECDVAGGRAILDGGGEVVLCRLQQR